MAKDVGHVNYPNHHKKIKNIIRTKYSSVLLVCLLVLLAGHLYFCLAGLLSLTVSLVIDGVVLIVGDTAIGLSG